MQATVIGRFRKPAFSTCAISQAGPARAARDRREERGRARRWSTGSHWAWGSGEAPPANGPIRVKWGPPGRTPDGGGLVPRRGVPRARHRQAQTGSSHAVENRSRNLCWAGGLIPNDNLASHLRVRRALRADRVPFGPARGGQFCLPVLRAHPGDIQRR